MMSDIEEVHLVEICLTREGSLIEFIHLYILYPRCISICCSMSGECLSSSRFDFYFDMDGSCVSLILPGKLPAVELENRCIATPSNFIRPQLNNAAILLGLSGSGYQFF